MTAVEKILFSEIEAILERPTLKTFPFENLADILQEIRTGLERGGMGEDNLKHILESLRYLEQILTKYNV